ncbi:MAG: hypothetical protein NTX40_00070, partial [Planctomycetota bacterium]|nr:hypothetical protein [Planctomycetota bacterium]
PGMVVSLTEDPEEPPEGDPNGVLRGLYSMTISDVLDPHDPEVTLKKVSGEGDVQVWKVREGEDPVLMLDTSEEESTTEDGDGNSLWDLLKDCSDHDVIITGVEAGEVQLGLELTVKGATKTKVAMDVVRITVLEMESTEWLVTHDPEFEHLYCQTPGDQGHPEWAGRFKQAVLMANEALVKVTKLTGINYKVKLCCNDVAVFTLDKTSTRYQEQGGFCIFHFETDEDQNNGADTDAQGRIFVEATLLTQGITQTGVKYTFELWANESKVCTREVTIKPLIDRLATPYSPWQPTNLFTDGFSPYTRPDYDDHRWEDTPVREMDAEDGDGGNHHWYFNRAYGMAIECEFTDELNNLTVKASGGDINGERTYAVADAAMYLQAATDRTIEWEGFDDDSEKIHDVADLSGLGTPLATPKVIRESEEYVLKISAKRKKDTTQEQALELSQIKVDYQLEHTFTEVTP